MIRVLKLRKFQTEKMAVVLDFNGERIAIPFDGRDALSGLDLKDHLFHVKVRTFCTHLTAGGAL